MSKLNHIALNSSSFTYHYVLFHTLNTRCKDQSSSLLLKTNKDVKALRWATTSRQKTKQSNQYNKAEKKLAGLPTKGIPPDRVPNGRKEPLIHVIPPIYLTGPALLDPNYEGIGAVYIHDKLHQEKPGHHKKPHLTVSSMKR